MDGLIQDLRYGVRMLARSPGFTAVAVAALALGIGANAAIFSIINTILLRPLPVPEPQRLVVARTVSGAGDHDNFSYPDLIDYRRQTDVFTGMLGRSLIHVALGHAGRNDLVWGELVTGDYFSVLGIAPALGRGFLPEEDSAPGAHHVVVIGHRLWEERFRSDAGIVGRSIAINGRDFTVIGVAPREFSGTEFALGMDLWVPLMMHQAVSPGSEGMLETRDWRNLDVIARLRPGASVETAAAAMRTVAERLAQSYPDTNRGLSATVVPEPEGRFPGEASGGVSLGAALALAVAGLVLLIACANVANLLMARAAARRREIGVRLALGARRRRLVRQLLTESLLLSILGGAFGLLLASWTSDLLLGFRPPIPYRLALDYAPDLRVVLSTAAASLCTVVVFGLVPALHASRADLIHLLKDGPGAAGRRRGRPSFGSLLVAGQVGLSLVVLVSAGLFLRSLRNAATIDPGFATRSLALGTYDVGLLGYSEDQGRSFARDLVRRLEALPGVASAAVLDNVPLDTNWNTSGPVIADGQPDPEDGRGIQAEIGVVSPGLFRTLGVALLRGRDFSEHDDASSTQVAIINETLATRLWPGEDPLGRRLRIGGVQAATREIVGVARDVKYRTLGESPVPFIYRPLLQTYRSEVSVLVRSRGDSAALIGPVRREVGAMDSRLPLYGLKTIEEHMEYALWWTRMGATLASIFGLLALVLAAVGLSGRMAYAVRQRTREIGLRMALGARPIDVQRLVVGRGLGLALAGIGGGLLAAAVLGRLMTSVLYDVGAFEPAVSAALALLLTAVAFLASYLPARRAARIDPMQALRSE